MAETVLIDEITKQQSSEASVYNTHYIRLTVNEESQLEFPAFKPYSLVVEEGFNKSYVACKLVLVDTFGFLVNAKPLEGDFLFTLYIGRSPEEYQTYKLKLRSVSVVNESFGESSDYEIEMSLISDYWQPMCHDRRTNAWSNTKFSDIVSDILDECGIERSVISETKRTQETTIKPYWTNAEMLKWMAPKSQGARSDTFYVYSAIADKMFFYCTFDDLMNNVVPSMFEFEPQDSRIFSLSGEALDGSEESRRRLTNLRIQSNYAEELSRGASGVNYGYYDFRSGKYVRGSHTYSESNERQLSDWAMISENQETFGEFMYGHRDSNTTLNTVHSTVSKEANKTLNLIGTTSGTTDVQVGELVSLIVPVNPENMTVQYSEYFSGKYIVSHKRTICNLENSTSETVLRFTRQGVNGSLVNTFTQSQRGKV